MSAFLWSARVYWEDTDAGGIVYYANYLRFMERARSEWLRTRGVAQRTLALETGVLFSVVSVQARYRRPARLDDQIVISCEPRRDGATMVFDQRIWRDSPQGELLLEGAVSVACLDAATLRPRRLPEFIIRDLNQEAN
ncbi:MAG: tol-pal system-associated acyl-CoA thioesterase [Steroidobacteraceae bacterium]